MTGTPQHLDHLARAVKRRALMPADIAALRAELERARLAAVTHGQLANTVQGIAALESQLAHLSQRLGERPLEPETFSDLPAIERRRVLTRLQAAVRRVASKPDASSTRRKRARPDPAFRCVAQHKRCCEATTDSRLWCHIALAVCLVRSMLKVIEKRAG